ncbi:DUF3325 domain-containing protein [Colwellia sp. 6_MG-2023]|uniref:DUF3325 domain-containing protein n=1 Tax=Colwellia sp. 6_MG-2023 TaxID=3062676 RepID=UPI0026E39AD1|nr:DUF3325 domain-containing protein [Colwellia sp. 6_MG-2023]MDO6487193.1 DUF3325 domain-containing protein [Colwellia sp. 6_MG-2023]
MLIVFLTQIIGLLCLSLSMDKHFKSIFKRALTSRLSLYFKISGWLTIIISLLSVSLMSFTFSIAILYWLAFLSVNILFVVIIYSSSSSKK